MARTVPAPKAILASIRTTIALAVNIYVFFYLVYGAFIHAANQAKLVAILDSVIDGVDGPLVCDRD